MELLDKENSTEDQRFTALHSKRAKELSDLKYQLEKRSKSRQQDESTSKLKSYIRLLQVTPCDLNECFRLHTESM